MDLVPQSPFLSSPTLKLEATTSPVAHVPHISVSPRIEFKVQRKEYTSPSIFVPSTPVTYHDPTKTRERNNKRLSESPAQKVPNTPVTQGTERVNYKRTYSSLGKTTPQRSRSFKEKFVQDISPKITTEELILDL